MNKIKVLIVDDSKLIRDVLTSIISTDARLEVVGTAEDPYVAREKIKELNPDVLTLDVEMPKMNGIAFLKNLMRLRPMPVVMISTLTAEGSQITMQALELGAIDFIAKPADLSRIMTEYKVEIISKILAASSVTASKLHAIQLKLTQVQSASTQPKSPLLRKPASSDASAKPAKKLTAIGGSTGSLEALKDLLSQVQFTGKEGIVVALHLPGKFTESYAKRLDSQLPLTVKEAEHGEPVREGHLYIAPGGQHLEVRKRAFGFECVITDDAPVNLHKPSVETLYNSVALQACPNAIGIILTGMGKDGAKALGRMKDAGMETFAQDEESSVVWGMPGAAVTEFKSVESRNVLNIVQLAQKVSELGH